MAVSMNCAGLFVGGVLRIAALVLDIYGWAADFWKSQFDGLRSSKPSTVNYLGPSTSMFGYLDPL